MSTVCLCMIVKNEEKNIRRCLDSVKNLVDEMIIIDTGSTDNTKSVCGEYGAEIYDFQWQEDFSAARNYGLHKASTDWILWMDADEELQLLDKKLLKKTLQNEEIFMFGIRLKHFYGTDFSNPGQYYISYHHRLFRNNREFIYKGAIHERVENTATADLNIPSPCSFLEIHHYGYMDDNIPEKSLRNLKILLKEKEKQENPWLDYHIAAELYRLKDHKKAFSFVNQSIAGFLQQGSMPPALAYKLKYVILLNSGDLDTAVRGIEKAIELYPDYVELHFYRGLILYGLERYEEAVKEFSYCLVIGEYNPDYLIMSGSGSFYASFYMGECYLKLHKKDFALEAYRQTLMQNSQFNLARERLG